MVCSHNWCSLYRTLLYSILQTLIGRLYRTTEHTKHVCWAMLQFVNLFLSTFQSTTKALEPEGYYKLPIRINDCLLVWMQKSASFHDLLSILGSSSAQLVQVLNQNKSLELTGCSAYLFIPGSSSEPAAARINYWMKSSFVCSCYQPGEGGGQITPRNLV